MGTTWDDAFAFLGVFCEASKTKVIENEIEQAKKDIAKAEAEHTRLQRDVDDKRNKVSALEKAVSASKLDDLPLSDREGLNLILKREQNHLKWCEADKLRERARIEMYEIYLRYKELQKEEADLNYTLKTEQAHLEKFELTRGSIQREIKTAEQNISDLDAEIKVLEPATQKTLQKHAKQQKGRRRFNKRKESEKKKQATVKSEAPTAENEDQRKEREKAELNKKLKQKKGKIRKVRTELKAGEKKKVALKKQEEDSKIIICGIKANLQKLASNVSTAESEWNAARGGFQDADRELLVILTSVNNDNERIDAQMNKLIDSGSADANNDPDSDADSGSGDANNDPDSVSGPGSGSAPGSGPVSVSDPGSEELTYTEILSATWELLSTSPPAPAPAPAPARAPGYGKKIWDWIIARKDEPPRIAVSPPNPTTASSWDDAIDFLEALTTTNGSGSTTSGAEMDEDSPLQGFNNKRLLELANRVYATIMEDPTAEIGRAITKELEDEKYDGVEPSKEDTDRIMQNIAEEVKVGQVAVESAIAEKGRYQQQSNLILGLVLAMYGKKSKTEVSGSKQSQLKLVSNLSKQLQVEMVSADYAYGEQSSCATVLQELLNSLMYSTYEPNTTRTAELFPLNNNSQLLKGLGVVETKRYYDNTTTTDNLTPIHIHVGRQNPVLQVAPSTDTAACFDVINNVEDSGEDSGYFENLLGKYTYSNARSTEQYTSVESSRYLVLAAKYFGREMGITVNRESFKPEGGAQKWVLHAGALHRGTGDSGHYRSFTRVREGQYRVYDFDNVVNGPNGAGLWGLKDIKTMKAKGGPGNYHFACAVYVREEYKHKVPVLCTPPNTRNTCWLSAAMVLIASMYERLLDGIISNYSGSSAASMASFRGRRRAPRLKKITGLKRRRARAPPPPRHRAGSVVDLTGQVRLYKGA